MRGRVAERRDAFIMTALDVPCLQGARGAGAQSQKDVAETVHFAEADRKSEMIS